MKTQFIEPQKDKIEYIIGIDFGHGETSAAYCRIEDMSDPIDIDLSGSGSKKTIPSTVFIDKVSNTISIGDEAVELSGEKEGNFYAYFKEAPVSLDENRQPNIKIMKLYMQKVYEFICNIHAGIFMEGEKIKENHLVFIACPSQSQSWTDKEMQNYVQLALDAGLPIAGAIIKDKYILSGIVRESRAAYIRFMQQNDERITQAAAEGILVIDFGSSTIDITYYKKGARPVDKGYPLGAKKVEESIYSYLQEEKAELKITKNPLNIIEVINNSPSLSTSCLFRIREAKEQFYSKIKTARKLQFRYETVQGYELDVWILKEIITDKILENYKVEIQNAFNDFKTEFIKDDTMTLLVLTGGASRMSFVSNIAQSVFGNVTIMPSQDSSLTVSNGIATAGRADVKLYYIAQDALSNAKITSPDIFSDVIQDAATDIAGEVIDDMHSSYESFKNQYSDESVVSLKERIAAKLKNRERAYQSRIQISFNYKLKAYINNIVDTILRKYVQEQFPEFDFSQIKGREIKDISVNISNSTLSTLEKVAKDAVETIEAGTIEIAIKALWDGAALILAGILKLIGEGAALIYKFITGKETNIKSYEEFYEMLYADWNDKDTKLKKSDRQKVYSAFSNNKESYKRRLINDIEYKLKNDSNLKSKILKASRDAVEEYVIAEINEIQRLIK